jgi:hypothetical protein
VLVIAAAGTVLVVCALLAVVVAVILDAAKTINWFDNNDG